jgi:hypothetical protein
MMLKRPEFFIRKERGGFRRGWAQMGPFRKRARAPEELAKFSKNDLSARARHTARGVDLSQI